MKLLRVAVPLVAFSLALSGQAHASEEDTGFMSRKKDPSLSSALMATAVDYAKGLFVPTQTKVSLNAAFLNAIMPIFGHMLKDESFKKRLFKTFNVFMASDRERLELYEKLGELKEKIEADPEGPEADEYRKELKETVEAFKGCTGEAIKRAKRIMADNDLDKEEAEQGALDEREKAQIAIEELYNSIILTPYLNL